MEKRFPLMVKFALMFLIFVAVTLVLNAVITYINQDTSYHEECKTNLRNTTDYLNKLLVADGEDFLELKAYFMENKDKLKIDYEYDGDFSKEKEAFETLFHKQYPDKVFGVDMTFHALNEQTKLAYARYKYEYWLSRFEEAAKSFGMEYVYFIYPTEGVKMCYMIDGVREKEEQPDGTYISLGFEADEERNIHENMWSAWETGENSKGFDTMDNEFGKVYSYFSPLVLHGEKVGLICADINVNLVNATIRSLVVKQMLITILVLGICSVLMIFFIRSSVLKRISLLEGHVKQYSREKDPRLAQEILAGSRSRDEIGSLSEEFADMIGELEEYMNNLQAVTAEKERIGAELDVATNIQASMLPSIFPPFPDREEFELFASMDPAKEVGGDFYDFFMTDEDHLAIVIADVSGKGVPAALFMVIAKTLIKNHAQLGESVAQILRNSNDQLDEGNGGDMFVTAWIGIYDIRTGELAFSEAGHENPLLLRRDGTVKLITPKKKRMPLASFAGIQYLPNKIQLKEGDCLFLYTDGVPEATNKEEELYGMERLEAFLKENTDLNPEELLKAVREDVDAFVGDAPQFDDLTMLAMKVREIREVQEDWI